MAASVVRRGVHNWCTLEGLVAPVTSEYFPDKVPGTGSALTQDKCSPTVYGFATDFLSVVVVPGSGLRLERAPLRQATAPLTFSLQDVHLRVSLVGLRVEYIED